MFWICTKGHVYYAGKEASRCKALISQPVGAFGDGERVSKCGRKQVRLTPKTAVFTIYQLGRK